MLPHPPSYITSTLSLPVLALPLVMWLEGGWMLFLLVVPALMLLPLRGVRLVMAKKTHEPIWRLLALFWILALLSAFWAYDPKETVTMGFRLFLLSFAGLILISAQELITPEQRQMLAKLLASAGLAGLTIFGFEVMNDAKIQIFLRQLIGENPPPFSMELDLLNRGAAILVLVLPALVVAWFGLLSRLWVIMLLILAGWVLLTTKMSSAFLAYIVGLFVVGILALFGTRALLIGGVIFAMGALALPFTIHPIFQQQPVLYDAQGFHPENDDPKRPFPSSNMSQRIDILRYSADRIHEKRFFGHGLQGSRYLSQQMAGLGPNSPLPAHPHNGVMQIWLELGALGILVFLLGLGALVRGIHRDREKMSFADIAKAATIAIALILGLLSFSAWQNWWQASLLLSAFYFALVDGSARDRSANDFPNQAPSKTTLS